MNIELSNEDVSLLDEILSKELNELPIEIRHTKSPEFKDFLKEKGKRIENLLSRIQ